MVRKLDTMTIPAEVTIGTVTYRVVAVVNLASEGKPYMGTIEHSTGTLKLDAALPEDIKLVTFWHEVIHGILRQAGQKHSEGLTDAISHGLVALFRANGWTIALPEEGTL